MHGPHTLDRCIEVGYNSQILPVHAAVLHTGKILWFAGSGNDPDKFKDRRMEARVWDPETGDMHRVEPHAAQRDLFCCGHAFLPDGRLLVSGGNAWYVDRTQAFYAGLRDTFLYDPLPEPGRWLRAADMREGRWYPTCVPLPDGRLLAFSGYRDQPLRLVPLKVLWPPFGYVNRRTEVWSPQGGLPPGPDTTPGTWTDLRANRGMAYYPRIHLLPTGEIVRTGPEPETLVFDPARRAWALVAQARGGRRVWGNSVLLPLRPPDYRARVLVLGGSEGELIRTRAKASAEILDREWSGTAWRYQWSWAPPMSFPRRHVSATILLDGRVLVGGGGRSANEGPVFETELYDPLTGTWRQGATCSVPRLYHSNAALLPDGRVWTGGGNPAQGVDELRIELYTPGYCLDRGRPEIEEEGPFDVHYSGTLSVHVKSADPVIEFALVRASSVTHSFNADQRRIALEMETLGGDRFRLTAPPRPELAPPGWYMLTALDEHRCPARARWAHLLAG